MAFAANNSNNEDCAEFHCHSVLDIDIWQCIVIRRIGGSTVGTGSI